MNDAMRRDVQHATMEHASNLGGLLADGIAATAGIKAYIADPVVVDEMDDIARLSGHPDCPRRSIFHALNQKATARLHCDRIGIVYEKANLVVAHLGGGVPLKSGDTIIGGLGISGGTGEEDLSLAEYGLSVLPEILG